MYAENTANLKYNKLGKIFFNTHNKVQTLTNKESYKWEYLYFKNGQKTETVLHLCQ